MGYVIRDRTIKIEIYGRFAECYTRQRGILSSARVKTLSKENTWPKSVHSGTKMASLSSVYTVTLSKAPTFVRSGPVFAECPVFDTRQRIQVCRVSAI